jgi:hypothetical protein
VLLITSIRDKAPVAALLHLVLNSRLVKVYMQASNKTRRARKGYYLAKSVCASYKVRNPIELSGKALSY